VAPAGCIEAIEWPPDFPYLAADRYLKRKGKEAMRAEIEAAADDVRKSLALLRRHL
jgi:hypothetical protein